jgi:hypothetical protein
VSFTITIVLISIGLSWSYRLLRPLIPAIVIAAIVAILLKLFNNRRDNW